MELNYFESRVRWAYVEANPFKMLEAQAKLKDQGDTVSAWYVAPAAMRDLLNQLANQRSLIGAFTPLPTAWQVGGKDLKVDHEQQYTHDGVAAIIAEGVYNIERSTPWQD